MDPKQLYNDLIKCTEKNKLFFYRDETSTDSTSKTYKYRIFDYHIASYSEWLLPNALNCRGTMFEISDNSNPKLVALPMKKFFNYNENPLAMYPDLSSSTDIFIKYDGSLISTYMEGLELKLKSKGALRSEQARHAESYLQLFKSKNVYTIYNLVHRLTDEGFTVNMEWCSPINRIVINYNIPNLVILNIRNRDTGELILPSDPRISSFVPFYLRKNNSPGLYGYPVFYPFLPEKINTKLDKLEIDRLSKNTGMEGYVVYMPDGNIIKLKNGWYLNLHSNKSSLSSMPNLFDLIINNQIDDLLSMFYDDSEMIQVITNAQKIVLEAYKNYIDTISIFYNFNKELSRKDFAIKAKAELVPQYFSAAMILYTGNDALNEKVFGKLMKEEILKTLPN